MRTTGGQKGISVMGLLLIIIAGTLVLVGIYYTVGYVGKQVDAVKKAEQARQMLNEQLDKQLAGSGLEANDISPLFSVEKKGGRCTYGQCWARKTVYVDGVWVNENGDGSVEEGKIWNAAIQRTIKLIENSDFGSIAAQKREPGYICPTAYDGSQFVYTFYTTTDIYVIDDCDVLIDEGSPLFKEITSL